MIFQKFRAPFGQPDTHSARLSGNQLSDCCAGVLLPVASFLARNCPSFARNCPPLPATALRHVPGHGDPLSACLSGPSSSASPRNAQPCAHMLCITLRCALSCMQAIFSFGGPRPSRAALLKGSPSTTVAWHRHPEHSAHGRQLPCHVPAPATHPRTPQHNVARAGPSARRKIETCGNPGGPG